MHLIYEQLMKKAKFMNMVCWSWLVGLIVINYCWRWVLLEFVADRLFFQTSVHMYLYALEKCLWIMMKRYIIFKWYDSDVFLQRISMFVGNDKNTCLDFFHFTPLFLLAFPMLLGWTFFCSLVKLWNAIFMSYGITMKQCSSL